MGLKSFVNKVVKQATKLGWICGSDFPVGTYINLVNEESGVKAFLLTYPNNTEEKVTNDMIKCATVLAMGVIDIEKSNNTTTSVYGTKYLCVFEDGRQGVITSGLGRSQMMIESVLF